MMSDSGNPAVLALSVFVLAVLAIGALPHCSGASSTKLVWTFKPNFPVSKLAVSPSGQHLALAGEHGAFALVDLSNQSVKRCRTEVAKPVYLHFAPDASEIWVIGADNSLARVDPNTGNLRASKGVSGKPVVWETTLAHGRFRLEVHRYGYYTLYRGDSTVPIANLEGAIIATEDGELMHRGGTILSASAADRLSIWSENHALSGAATRPLAAPQAVAIACDGSCVILAANAKAEEAFLWAIDPPADKPARFDGRLFLDRDRSGRARLASNRKANTVLAATSSGLSTLRLSTDGIGTVIASTDFHPVSARLSDNGTVAVALNAENKLLIANPLTLKPFPPLAGLESDQSAAVIGPTAEYALLPREDGQSALVDLPNRQVEILNLRGDEWLPQFSNTGQWLGILSQASQVRLLESHSGADVEGFSSETVLVRAFHFTKNDAYVVFEQLDGGLSIWQLNAD